MRSSLSVFAAGVLVFVVLHAVRAAEPAPGTIASKDIVIEVESMTLTDAKIVELKGASGGKAVVFPTEKGKATTKIKLAPGRYSITLYVQAEDEDHDATFLHVNKEPEYRLWAEEKGKVVACEEEAFLTVKEEGEQTIALTPAETEVKLDRIVIRRIK